MTTFLRRRSTSTSTGRASNSRQSSGYREGVHRWRVPRRPSLGVRRASTRNGLPRRRRSWRWRRPRRRHTSHGGLPDRDGNGRRSSRQRRVHPPSPGRVAQCGRSRTAGPATHPACVARHRRRSRPRCRRGRRGRARKHDPVGASKRDRNASLPARLAVAHGRRSRFPAEHLRHGSGHLCCPACRVARLPTTRRGWPAAACRTLPIMRSHTPIRRWMSIRGS